MICALILSVPTSFADEGDDPQDGGLLSLLSPVTDPLEEQCVSMLEVTLVSFGGKISESSPSALYLEEVVKGQLHTTITTIEEVWHFPGQLANDKGIPLGETPVDEIAGPAFLELIETTRTTVEEFDAPMYVHVEWRTDTIDWERVERTTLVPLPADLSGVDPANIATACGEESFQVEAPYYGEEYDVMMVGWWPEQFAPETPESEEYVRILDLTLGTEASENINPMSLEEGFLIAPTDVEHAVLKALAEHAPVVYETITEEESNEEESDGEESGEGEDSEDAEASPASASGGMPVAATASIGTGLGLAGLLGTVLALRRR